MRGTASRFDAAIMFGSLMLALAALSTTSARAGTIIIQHQGATNPTTEGFTLWPFNGGISSGGILNDMGLPAWSITSTAPGSQQALYLGSFTSDQQTALQTTQGFTMSLEARAVSGPVYSGPSNEPIVAGIVGFGSVRYDLELGLDANGNTVALLASNVITNADGSFSIPGVSVTLSGNGYHLYQLAYNPTTQKADLFIDGVDRIQGYQGHSDNPFTGFLFGALNHGTANFNLAKLETGFDVVTIPEPSSLLMGSLSALTLLGCSVWRRLARTSR
jgi:hypothetical protein